MLLTRTETRAVRGLTDLFCHPRYYGVGDGILDTHFQPKVATELREIASMNAPVVLLLAQPEDDLPIPDAAPRFQT